MTPDQKPLTPRDTTEPALAAGQDARDEAKKVIEDGAADRGHKILKGLRMLDSCVVNLDRQLSEMRRERDEARNDYVRKREDYYKEILRADKAEQSLAQAKERIAYHEQERENLILAAENSLQLEESVKQSLADPSKPYARKQEARLRLLHPQAKEIWELRSVNNEPSLRIFGRFAAVDTFVALTWWRRDQLGAPTSRSWRNARVGCRTEWDNLFNPYQPPIGADIHDYISSEVVLI